jgi:DNA gyrase/topoisomerase IV subunit A
LARLAQPFSVKVPLIYGQGNFGSEEMPPAHMRYTEAKLSPLGYALTSKLDKNIVPMSPNYDGTEIEPEFLFAPVPLLLNTGALGIGVGI